MDRAKEFYETVFQLKLERLNSPGLEMWSFPMAMDRVGASGALVKMDGFPSGGNSTLVYFTCLDCDVETERVTAIRWAHATREDIHRSIRFRCLGL